MSARLSPGDATPARQAGALQRHHHQHHEIDEAKTITIVLSCPQSAGNSRSSPDHERASSHTGCSLPYAAASACRNGPASSALT